MEPPINYLRERIAALGGARKDKCRFLFLAKPQRTLRVKDKDSLAWIHYTKAQASEKIKIILFLYLCARCEFCDKKDLLFGHRGHRGHREGQNPSFSLPLFSLPLCPP